MGRRVRDYQKELWTLFWDYSKSGDFGRLREYLLARSGLPGPRGNLELATAFASVAQRGAISGAFDPQAMRSLCESLAGIPPSLAPTNDPKEFLVFCGACGLGAIGTREADFASATAALRVLADDQRWRTREGVAMALQRLLEARPKQSLSLLSKWAEEGDALLLRAVAAGIAEPRLLKDEGMARSALNLHRRIFLRLPEMDRKGENFKALKKGLSYSLSVVVAALPQEGFDYMSTLAQENDADIRSILKENLSKKRLNRYPTEKDRIQKLL
jgi:hypothetical protein